MKVIIKLILILLFISCNSSLEKWKSYDETEEIGVPESAVTIQGNTAFVYVVANEIAEKKDIKVGKRNFGKVSVLSGIIEGDIVITEGVSKVRNKKKVKIINP